MPESVLAPMRPTGHGTPDATRTVTAAKTEIYWPQRLIVETCLSLLYFGSERWAAQTAVQLDLESTLRPRGRPRKKKK
jgi:hypothetical protein